MTQINVHRPNRPARPGRPVRPGGWGGFSDFFDEFLHDRAGRLEPRAVRSRGVYPPVNLHETADAFILTAELPGVAPEDIDVSLEGKTVTLSGQRKIDYAAGDGTAIHRRERQSGHFKRAFELPSPFDVEAAEAKHGAGVLELRLPKTPDSKPRQIEVQTS
jgi:HSP20 family protein